MGVLLAIGLAGIVRAVPPAPDLPPEDPVAKLARVEAEIRQLVRDCHARLSRAAADCVGAIYARYSSRHQDSIVDQVRTLIEEAVQKKIFVPAEFVFFDMAVRGYKNDRAGLNAFRACLRSKAVKAVLFFATNRLFRKNYRSLQFVEEQVVERGIRAIFVKSGVDTADAKRWRSLLNMHAMMDEFVVGMNVDHIRAGHEGLVAKALVFGTISYGYRGDVVPGALTRKGRPRRALAVDAVAAAVVRNVFTWFVADRLTVIEIVRRLNADPGVPLPPKCRANRGWSRAAVRKVLTNTRYRGWWKYGATETVWVSSKDYARQIKRDRPLKAVQLDELRLVDDATWYAAQAFLEQEAAKVVGRKPRDGDGASRPRLLNGLFRCPTHDRKLYVGGPHGRSMFCKDCQATAAADRRLFSLLPRALALRQTCATLAELIRRDADLVDRIVDSCRRHAEQQQVPDPAARSAVAAKLAKVEQRIQFVLRNPGDTDADVALSEAVLKQWRQERAGLRTEHDALAASAARAVVVPTVGAVRTLLDDLGGLLVRAGAGDSEQAGRVRQIIEVMTDGRIDLYQQGERRAKRGWLQGRFPNRLVAGVARLIAGVEVGGEDTAAADVVIDYQPEKEVLPEAVVAEIIDGYEKGDLVKAIARRVEVSRTRVAGVLEDWHARQNREYVDGRTRRASLRQKHLEPPLYQRAADRVKELADGGHLFDAIAAALAVDRNTVTAAWKYWHESRGLVPPDGRTRRKSLPAGTKQRTTPP